MRGIARIAAAAITFVLTYLAAPRLGPQAAHHRAAPARPARAPEAGPAGSRRASREPLIVRAPRHVLVPPAPPSV